MNSEQLFRQIQQKKSYLCVGLDTDKNRIPKHLLSEDDPVFSFNKAIIDSTAAFAVAFKPNTAFYESGGSRGWQSLERTVAYIREKYPDIFIILDAKRGDIGNTSAAYARAFFESMQADAVTVAPYMGADSVKPFLGFEEKWVILLALTSNTGSADFQYFADPQGQLLHHAVIRKACTWASPDQLMFVVGATHPQELAEIRKIVPDYFLLVPGVGAQGGDLDAVSRVGLNQRAGLLVNSSRAIIYASDGSDFDKAAAHEASLVQRQMETQLELAGLI